jgi:acyl-coenzyme A thioesterase 13
VLIPTPPATRHLSSLANTRAVGKTLAFTSIAFSNTKGDVFARGSHTKYVALAWKDPNNIVEELSPKQSEKKE